MTRTRRETWWIAAAGRAYGPYDFDRLVSFAEEGRLDGATLVAHEAEGPYAPAHSEPRIAARLAVSSQPKPILEPDVRVRADASRPSARLHLVVAQFSSNTAAEAFAASLAAFGERVDAAPGVWLLRADLDAASLRNRLSRGLSTGERLIVTETGPDQAAWFALGGEADRAMRRLFEALRGR